MHRVTIILLLGLAGLSKLHAQTDDLFTVNKNGEISRVSPQGTVTPFGTVQGISGLGAVGFAGDYGGNLYLAAPDREPANSPGAGGVGGYAIYRVDRTGKSTVFARGFPQLGMLAFDAHGTLFAGSSKFLFKISPAGKVTKLTTNITGPAAIAFDQKGVLFVANVGDGTIRKVDALTGANEIFTRGFDHPEGLAFDAAGNLLVADFYVGLVSRVSNTGIVTPLAQVRQARNLAIGPEGNLYVSSEGVGSIFKVDQAGAVTVLTNQLSYPLNLSFDHPLLKPAPIVVPPPPPPAPGVSPVLLIACALPALILLVAAIFWFFFREKKETA